jgi:hypothetical protein
MREESPTSIHMRGKLTAAKHHVMTYGVGKRADAASGSRSAIVSMDADMVEVVCEAGFEKGSCRRVERPSL